MDASLLIGFWVLSMALAMTPGADWAYAISAGMQRGALVPALLGMLSGYVSVIIVVAAGVGVLVAGVPMFLMALTLGGAAYLMWLGVKVFANPPVPTMGQGEDVKWSKWLGRGFGVSGTNPKVLLLFLALLPQFTNPSARLPLYVQMSALGLIHIVNCALVYVPVGLGSQTILSSRPKAAQLVGKASGIIMVAIAFVLTFEQVANLISG